MTFVVYPSIRLIFYVGWNAFHLQQDFVYQQYEDGDQIYINVAKN